MSLDRRSTEGLPLIYEFCGQVIEDDDQREQWLELHGEHPNRLPCGSRRPCECCDGDEGSRLPIPSEHFENALIDWTGLDGEVRKDRRVVNNGRFLGKHHAARPIW